MWSQTAENPLPSQRFPFLTEVLHKTAVALRKISCRGNGAEAEQGGTEQERDRHGQAWKSEGSSPHPCCKDWARDGDGRWLGARARPWDWGNEPMGSDWWSRIWATAPSYAWARGLMPTKQHLHLALCSSVQSDYWNRPHGVVLAGPPLEVFKVGLDGALSNLS